MVVAYNLLPIWLLKSTPQEREDGIIQKALETSKELWGKEGKRENYKFPNIINLLYSLINNGPPAIAT